MHGGRDADSSPDQQAPRRNHLGLSQEALATAADVSPETIRRLERGDTQPNLFTFCKVAEALGSTASVMLAETQDQEATGLLTMPPPARPGDRPPHAPSPRRPHGRPLILGSVEVGLREQVRGSDAEDLRDPADQAEVRVEIAPEDRQQAVVADAARAGDRVEWHPVLGGAT